MSKKHPLYKDSWSINFMN